MSPSVGDVPSCGGMSSLAQRRAVASRGRHPAAGHYFALRWHISLMWQLLLTEYSRSGEEKGSKMTRFYPSSMDLPSKASRRYPKERLGRQPDESATACLGFKENSITNRRRWPPGRYIAVKRQGQNRATERSEPRELRKRQARDVRPAQLQKRPRGDARRNCVRVPAGTLSRCRDAVLQP
jgi:hypothetical protein